MTHRDRGADQKREGEALPAGDPIEALRCVSRALETLGKDYIQNMRRLAGLCRHVQHASAAIYARMERGLLTPKGCWNIPKELQTEDVLQGRVCADLIESRTKDTKVYRQLRSSGFVATDPWVRTLDCQTLVAKNISPEGDAVGVLCVFFAKDLDPSDLDLCLLDLVSSAIAAEQRRHRAERERSRYLEQLQQAQKMEAIGVLAGGLAHDMNNTLTAILGFASLVQSTLGANAPIAQDIDGIIDACERGRQLTSNLLGFARKGHHQNKIHPDQLVEDVVRFLKRTIPKAVTVRKNLGVTGPVVEGDSGLLTQVLVNLAINASDAMGGAGTLTFETYTTTISSKTQIMGMEVPPGVYVTIRVIDTGVGMGPETQEHAFEPFFTTKRKGHGTGLGLATAFATVTNHGGLLLLESAPGKGTTASVLLPASETSHAAIETKRRASRSAEKGSGTILIVDDEDVVRGSGKRLLERLGFSVLLAKNGREGVDVFEQHKSNIRLVILDLMMPEMGGEEAFRRMRKIRADAPVLLCSGYSNEQTVEALLTDGALGFLPKPFDLDELSQKLDSVLAPPSTPR